MRQQKTEERIKKALNRGDDFQIEKVKDYMKKQENAEKIRKKFAEEREKKAKEQEITRKNKEKEIMKILKKNDELILKRVEEYNKKQEKIMERQKMQEEENKKKLEKKHLELCEKEKRCIETRLRNEKIIERYRQDLINKINSNQEKIIKQKEKNVRGNQERLIEQAMRQEDIEDNLRMKERAKEFVRMKKLEEMEEKSRRAENIKMQKMRIYEERRKMNRSLEKDKENLLMKFNELMSQRGEKSKEQVMKQLFEGEEGLEYRNNKNSKTMANLGKSLNKENEKIKEEEDYNDFQKEDNFFVTNLPKESLVQNEET